MLLALALLKKLRTLDEAVRTGSWPVWQYRSSSYELAGKTLGIVGLGRIGHEVASRANAFQMSVIYYDQRRLPAADESSLQVSYQPLVKLLAASDVVSLHLPLAADTEGLVDHRFLASMKPGALLINTARGALVDESALLAALRDGVIAGAGLDVLANEPPDPRNGLLTMDNVIITPHVAAGTRDAFLTKLRAIFANMQRVVDGQPPTNLVRAVQTEICFDSEDSLGQRGRRDHRGSCRVTFAKAHAALLNQIQLQYSADDSCEYTSPQRRRARATRLLVVVAGTGNNFASTQRSSPPIPAPWQWWRRVSRPAASIIR